MADLSDNDKAVLNCVFNPHLPLEEAGLREVKELEDFEEETLPNMESQKLEIAAVKSAEDGNLNEALALINKAIKITPNRPSLYNNRAHIYQYLKKFDEAFMDTNKAISLCNESFKKTLCLSHCQRGVLHRKNNSIELAQKDFEVAAKLGNKFAKGQLVELNPYAALCNQMLKQVMETYQ